MFVLWTTLPFDRISVLSGELGPPYLVDRTYSGLVPGVKAGLNNSPALRRKLGSEEMGMSVTAASLDKIRAWLEAVVVHHNGGAQSIDDEEMTASLDEYMQQVLNDTHPDGHVIFRK